MHYDTTINSHGLKHDPFKALVVPRPIGWIGTVSGDGIYNLAPYSFYNAIADRPHYVMFSSSNVKDSLRNIRETGEFTCSMATWDTRFEMNISSAPVPSDVDEFPIAGLTATASKFVRPPRVKESPAALECRHWKTIELPDVDGEIGHFLVIGHVVGIYIDDNFVHDGIVDTAGMRPLARMGYMQYATVTPETTLVINRPQTNDQGEVTDNQAEVWDGTYR